MQEGNEEPFNIRLHLAKDILTIQEQDVICVSGEPFYSSVSNSVRKTLKPSSASPTLPVFISAHSSVNLFLINQIQQTVLPLDQGLQNVI